ncbi:hypothetical protein Pcinc_039381 [Petrolisthes cinctipes]|uniref:Uncharacterized protein n=1 Tax=Petrolisthes cinctipes TaxID=88211 RepID=A0AAE1BNJ9_PETCI|nr:hypothetical protein Pcinc_039381 [Petrolisthes cinctipes]
MRTQSTTDEHNQDSQVQGRSRATWDYRDTHREDQHNNTTEKGKTLTSARGSCRASLALLGCMEEQRYTREIFDYPLTYTRSGIQIGAETDVMEKMEKEEEEVEYWEGNEED